MTTKQLIQQLDSMKEDAGILLDAVHALKRQGLPRLASTVELAYTELRDTLS
jgi:hypothetical protein